ncbi:MAG: hypothetical protein AAGD23_07615 [Pseudomonadota bacterium]
MQQFYSVLVQQVARIDASDGRQRAAVYDRARSDLSRLMSRAGPDVSRAQSAELERAIAKLESEIEQIQAGNAARDERETRLREAHEANPKLAETRLADLNLPQSSADSAIEPRPVQDLLPASPFENPDPLGTQAARDRIDALRREIAELNEEPEPEPEPVVAESAPSDGEMRFEGGRWERTKAGERGPAEESAFPSVSQTTRSTADIPPVAPSVARRDGDERHAVRRTQQHGTDPRRPGLENDDGVALPVTQTRLPPRLGRDPQHLLRAKSIGSPTVFALLGASGAVALIGLIALVVALDPATGGVGADPGQRPIVLFSPTRPTQFQVPRGNSYLRIPGDNGGVHLSSRIADLSTGPNSAAIAVRIAPVATDVLQGNRAEVQIEARQVGDRPSRSFAVAYRTSTGPDSGWFEFQPGPEFSAYSFSYTVPVAQRDDIVHDILIWADTAAQGGTIEVRSITITMGG